MSSGFGMGLYRYNKCTVLWFGEWKKASMKEVSHLMIPRMLELVKNPCKCLASCSVA